MRYRVFFSSFLLFSLVTPLFSQTIAEKKASSLHKESGGSSLSDSSLQKINEELLALKKELKEKYSAVQKLNKEDSKEEEYLLLLQSVNGIKSSIRCRISV